MAIESLPMEQIGGYVSGQNNHYLHLDQRQYQVNRDNVDRIIRRIEEAYRKAPYFEPIFGFVRDLMTFGDADVAAFNAILSSVWRFTWAFAQMSSYRRSLTKIPRRRGDNGFLRYCKRLGATTTSIRSAARSCTAGGFCQTSNWIEFS